MADNEGEAKYHLTYNMESHPEGLTKEQVLAKECGGCDAVILISIILPEDGSYHQATVSMNGKEQRQLTPAEHWKAWAMLAFTLKDNPELSAEKAAMCARVHADVVRMIRSRE